VNISQAKNGHNHEYYIVLCHDEQFSDFSTQNYLLIIPHSLCVVKKQIKCIAKFI